MGTVFWERYDLSMRQLKAPVVMASLRKGVRVVIVLLSLMLGLLYSVGTAFGSEKAVDSEAETETVTEAVQKSAGGHSADQNSADKNSTNQNSTDSKPTHNTFFNLPDQADRGRAENAGAAPEGGLVRMVFSLIGVIALIFICGAVAKRLGAQGPMRLGAVQVRSVQSIGTKEKLMVINAYGKPILIGVTPHSIHTLHTFESGELEAFEAEQESAASATPVNPMDTLLSKIGIKSSNRGGGRAEEREHNKFEEMLQKERVEQSEVDQKV